MPTKVNIPSAFARQLRKLAKKYPAVVKEFEGLSEQLQADERLGDKVPGVGHDVYKARLPNPSAGRGKSGGFRVIYYVQLADVVLMLTIYAKTQQTDVSPQEIRALLDDALKAFDEDDAT